MAIPRLAQLGYESFPNLVSNVLRLESTHVERAQCRVKILSGDFSIDWSIAEHFGDNLRNFLRTIHECLPRV